MKKKIEKIKLLGFELKQATEEEYQVARSKYIAGYREYLPGGFFSFGEYKNLPDIGEANWNKMYPQGFKNWTNHEGEKLTSYGQQLLIDKINEIINRLNK